MSKEFFKEAYERFKKDAEFLFYAGFMICIAEWNYGVEELFGEKMIDAAFCSEPNNYLYSWSRIQHTGDYWLDCFRVK